MLEIKTKDCYYSARNYDPYSGRFLSEDPKGLKADNNLYRYAGNNPVIRRDPYGKDWRWILVGGAIVAIWIVNDISDPDTSEIIGGYRAAKKTCDDVKKSINEFKDDSKKKWNDFWKDEVDPEKDTDPNSGNPTNQPPNRNLM